MPARQDLHEARLGEMAALGEVPFGRYTQRRCHAVFVMLAGRYYKRTNDLAFIKHIWSHVELALKWIDEYGTSTETAHRVSARKRRGLVNQGWKDSFDSIFTPTAARRAADRVMRSAGLRVRGISAGGRHRGGAWAA